MSVLFIANLIDLALIGAMAECEGALRNIFAVVIIDRSSAYALILLNDQQMSQEKLLKSKIACVLLQCQLLTN